MTLKQLDSMIAQVEGGKSNVKIGDIREIRRIIFMLIKTNPEAAKLLFKELGR